MNAITDMLPMAQDRPVKCPMIGLRKLTQLTM